MSAICSSHNLIQFEQLNFDLSIHYYALRLLDSVPDEDRKDAWNRLLCERISVMDDTVRCLELLEDCIRIHLMMNLPRIIPLGWFDCTLPYRTAATGLATRARTPEPGRRGGTCAIVEV